MTVKEAVTKAKELAKEFFSEESVSAYQLEEVVFDDMRNMWEITIGYYVKDLRPASGGLSEALMQMHGDKKFERKYKIFRISNADGSFIAMRIRETSKE
jgi:predicted sulfurtransferase